MSANDARRLFEGMRTSPPSVSGVDHISALPDNVLHDILSLLPAQEAMRTCVLARSWRHLWRFITSLRFVGRDGPGPAQDLRKFVDNLLNLREKRIDLHTVEIKFGEFSEDDLPNVSLWIRSAVMCKIPSLTLHIHGSFLYLDGTHLASPHLRTVDLLGVALQYNFIDFASCPALEDLKMHRCDICVIEISSSSLKNLSITGCISDCHSRLHVSAPGLVSLILDDFAGPTPFFESMVLLERAWVNLGADGGAHCVDICCNKSGVLCGVDNACYTCEDFSGDLVLLCGISSVRHLELISEFPNIIFARDLGHRPIFSNLKTLLLNEYWCVPPAGCDQLACILKNSPVLEKLTLELFSMGPNHEVEMKGSYMTMEGPSAISHHLKIVELKCNVIDGRILEVLKFLCASNIRFYFE